VNVIIKRAFIFAIALSLLILTACSSNGRTGVSPAANDNSDDFASNIPVEVDDDILQSCYSYAAVLGYDIQEKEDYSSVLLGGSNVSTVHLDDDANADMVDENDCLVIFLEIRVVVDADTGAVLGRIPYV
jgi:hypothetical protein